MKKLRQDLLTYYLLGREAIEGMTFEEAKHLLIGLNLCTGVCATARFEANVEVFHTRWIQKYLKYNGFCWAPMPFVAYNIDDLKSRYNVRINNLQKGLNETS